MDSGAGSTGLKLNDAKAWEKMMSELCRPDRLENGLMIRYVDQSNRYFGDYHRVRIEVTLEFCFDNNASRQGLFDEELLSAGRAALGDSLVVKRYLQRMAVPSAEVATVLQTLIQDFRTSALSYLAHPLYPQRLVREALVRRRKPGRFNPMSI